MCRNALFARCGLNNIVEFKTTGEYLRTVDFPIDESLQGVYYNRFCIIGSNYLGGLIQKQQQNPN